MVRTKVQAIQCPSCQSVIYSRARHDFHSCKCGDVSIDGGFDYTRFLFKKEKPQVIIKYVQATRKALYDDWNYRREKYGVIDANIKHKRSRKKVRR